MSEIKVLAFDTGGTVLDWHSGFRDAFKHIGKKNGFERNWGELANNLRKKSMKAMLQLGQNKPPSYTFDDAHRFCLEEVLTEEGITQLSDEDKHYIAYVTPHNFSCWSDFPKAQKRLREKFLVCSFTILSYRLIIDTARSNGLNWDAIFSCEGIGKYKMLPEPYIKVLEYLQVQPNECLMVAAHPWDLNAARDAGFKTAYVARESEWGHTRPPWADSVAIEKDSYDIVVDNFSGLTSKLGI